MASNVFISKVYYVNLSKSMHNLQVIFYWRDNDDSDKKVKMSELVLQQLSI